MRQIEIISWRLGKDKDIDDLVLSSGILVKKDDTKVRTPFFSQKGNIHTPNVAKKRQRMCTIMIDSLIDSKDNIVWVYKYYPAFKNFKDKTERETNIKVSVVNILLQSSEGLNERRDALSNYHIDSKLEKRNKQVSVILW